MILSFGNTLKELRLNRNLTQSELAHKISVSKSMIGLYENNSRMPSPEILLALSHVFGVSVDYLLGVDKKPVIEVAGLTPKQIKVVDTVVNQFREDNETRQQKI